MPTENSSTNTTTAQQQQGMWELWQMMLKAAKAYFQQPPDKWKGSTIDAFRKFLADNNVVIDWAGERGEHSEKSTLSSFLDSVELPAFDPIDDDPDLHG